MNILLIVYFKKIYYLVFIRERFDSCNFATLGIPASSGSHVNLRVVLEVLGSVEDATAIVRANDGVFAILTEVSGRYELCLSFQFVPQSHFLIRNIP